MARRFLGLATVVLLMLGAGAAIEVRRAPSAGEVLAAARAFVHQHHSARFSGTVTVNFRDRTTLSGGLEGEIEALYHSRATVLWENGERSETFSGDYDIALLLDAARHPKTLRSSRHRTTISADLDVTDLIAEDGRGMTAMTLRVTVARDGEVESAVVTLIHEAGTTTSTLRYTRWGNRDITVAAPAAVLEDWHESALYMPRRLPAGWEHTNTRVLAAKDTQEGCSQVFVSYERTSDPEAGFVNLYQFPATCALPFTGDGVVPFTTGAHSGFGRYSRTDGAVVQFDVGATTVQAESDLTLAELAVMLADLVPLEL